MKNDTTVYDFDLSAVKVFKLRLNKSREEFLKVFLYLFTEPLPLWAGRDSRSISKEIFSSS